MPGRVPPLMAAVAAVAVALPLGLAAVPGGWVLFAAPRTRIILATALFAAPALAGLAAALRGVGEVRSCLATPDAAVRQVVVRLLIAAALLAYSVGIETLAPGEPAIRCLMIGALGVACAWLFLVHAILIPAPSALRRMVAMIVDIGLLSAFLHAGDVLTAAWYPLYPYLAIRSGVDDGSRARWLATGLSLAGFGVVVATTAFWRSQSVLSAGSLAAIALLPVYVASLLRALVRAREQAEADGAAKVRLLAGLADDLRETLRALLRAGAKLNRTGLTEAESEIVARMRLSARAALVQVEELPTYAAIEAGEFAPETRSFDLYQLIHGAAATLRPQAADRGIALGVRIDPRLPYELRGWPHQLRQLLVCLVASAVRRTERGAIEVQLDPIELSGDGVSLRMAVRDHGNRVERARGAGGERHGSDPTIVIARRLARAMGGRLKAAASSPRNGLEFTCELPFTIDRAATAQLLDLDGLPVLVATEDPGFADELVAALGVWRAEAMWIGAAEPALSRVEALPAAEQRPVLIVDGRDDVVSALSWAHRAIRTNPAAAPYVLFVAAESRIDSVIGLAEGQLDAILPAPFTHGVLQSALHALRVGAADWFPSEPLPAPVPVLAAPLLGRRAAVNPRPSPTTEDGTEAAQPVLPRRHRAARPPVRHGPSHILLAAANVANRKIIGHILGSTRFVAHLVADADQALAALDAREIDLILLDLGTPHDADLATAKRCRAAYPEVPIVALSAGDEPDASLAGVGIDAVLAKPIEPSRLLAAIEAALGGSPPQPAPPFSSEPPRSDAVITDIASHPRFAGADPATADAARIDPHAVDALWSLGGGAFFDDLVATFRADSRQILQRIGGAVAVGDITGFAAAVQAL
ncbi:MAG: ATP-binding response regulator, partial [Stellaceae bacterium]